MAEIAKAYSPKSVEAKWYKHWLEHGCFEGKADSDRESYCIMIPPPNVTGRLTMGHVLNNTIQDILIRRARQQGKATLWLPGTDHAGIATQSRVERELKAAGKSRHDLGREAFFQKACEWRDEHGGIIFEQLQRLGASCDWGRSVHTLDDDYSNAVITSFVKLYERGYIYRGKRMVNWCPISLTALSDEEVIMKPQKGSLYKMRYPVVERPGEHLEISTTRPETIMGDTAVAVHPEDERYKHLIGLHCMRPFPQEPIPIIADEAVEREFGTGALKVTPAHDKVDFEIGQRHKLPSRDVMHPDGRLNELAGEEFSGKDRFEARKLAAQKLKELDLLVDVEVYENSVGFSERADVPVEPRISDQWFLRYPQVEEAKQVVRDGLIRFYPQRWVKTYLHWLDNIQDWCISRQLW
ncbi:MAG TPA: valine--tRNA ligase, partial [Opitutae bacterium]|nr:valine--tRNA ligase [Opitutae bacterium]